MSKELIKFYFIAKPNTRMYTYIKNKKLILTTETHELNFYLKLKQKNVVQNTLIFKVIFENDFLMKRV